MTNLTDRLRAAIVRFLEGDEPFVRRSESRAASGGLINGDRLQTKLTVQIKPGEQVIHLGQASEKARAYLDQINRMSVDDWKATIAGAQEKADDLGPADSKVESE